MKGPSKATKEVVRQRVEKYLEDCGGVQERLGTISLPEYKVPTQHGPAEVWLLMDETAGRWPWVALRYAGEEARDKALAAGVDCNPYSGKYNCHLSNAMDAETMVRAFVRHLESAGVRPTKAENKA